MSTEEKKPRITSITIENFKGIGAPVTIPLRGLTLLFGKNSIGKSTIIEALLLMNDWMQNIGPDLDTLTLGGDVVHLGGFERFVYGHDLSREVRIRIDIDLGDAVLPRYPSAIIDSYRHDEWDKEAQDEDDQRDLDSVDVHNLIEVKSYYFEIVAKRSSKSKKAVFSEYSVGINGGNVISVKKCELGVFLSKEWVFNHAHPAVKALKSLKLMVRKLLNYHADKGVLCFFSPGSNFCIFGFDSLAVEDWDKVINVGIYSDEYTEVGRKRYRLRAEEKIHPYEYSFIEHFVSQVLRGGGKLVSSLLSDQIFIGPLREVPARILSSDIAKKKHCWTNGSQAWAEVLSPKYAPPDGKEPWSQDKADETFRQGDADAALKMFCNQFSFAVDSEVWGRLEIPQRRNYLPSIERFNIALNQIDFKYTFGLKTTLKVPDDSTFMRAAYALKEHPCSKKTIDALVSALDDSFDAEHELVFIDRESGFDLRAQELGTGVSQMIPILVGAMLPSSVLSVQQPELHLHPALQCELASYLTLLFNLFIKNNDLERMILLETHSEHMILRILSHIRKSKTEQDNNSKIMPDDLSVLYVSEASDGVRVTQIRVDDQGQFIDEWPEGFFEEGFNEIAGGL
jgi:hypothetical protein